ncbi:hypothetical protein PoB_001322600 [Plakobranchus ocellatus]|uniref:Uncharacterized protein n=1 Tax=Plakobranchus ocellatus TaxID=259542 RepID=A0AAV3YHC5_9GAST|nr:hypothetical protein PoB_001322600 [Plakobranchus ocellatus]
MREGKETERRSIVSSAQPKTLLLLNPAQPVHNKVISGFRALRQTRGSNPRHRSPCRSQGELASHCATDAPIIPNDSINSSNEIKIRDITKRLWPSVVIREADPSRSFYLI